MRVLMVAVTVVMMNCLVSTEALHTSPSIVIPPPSISSQEPKPLHTHIHTTDTHAHQQCLIKAHLLIIDDRALDVNLTNIGQLPGASLTHFMSPEESLNHSVTHLLSLSLKGQNNAYPTLSRCRNKWVYFVRQL